MECEISQLFLRWRSKRISSLTEGELTARRSSHTVFSTPLIRGSFGLANRPAKCRFAQDADRPGRCRFVQDSAAQPKGEIQSSSKSPNIEYTQGVASMTERLKVRNSGTEIHGESERTMLEGSTPSRGYTSILSTP